MPRYMALIHSDEQACELAAEIPAAEHGAIEVRPAYVDSAEPSQAEPQEVSA